MLRHLARAVLVCWVILVSSLVAIGIFPNFILPRLPLTHRNIVAFELLLFVLIVLTVVLKLRDLYARGINRTSRGR